MNFTLMQVLRLDGQKKVIIRLCLLNLYRLYFLFYSLCLLAEGLLRWYISYIKKKTKDKCAFNNSFKYKTDSYLINVLLNSCAKLICQNIREITKQLLLQETPLILKPKWQ